MMDSHNTTAYTPLDDSKSQIRLLEAIHEGPELIWKVSAFHLEDAPQFAALSYVWGTASATESIQVNHEIVRVTPNLAGALARSHTHWCESFPTRISPFFLWVDALCINQADLEEKSHQIPLMGKIFSSAELVISWLGADDWVMHSGMDTIELLYSEITKLTQEEITSLSWLAQHSSLARSQRYITSPVDWKSPWAALNEFANSEYWHRAWVFQEVVLARRAVITCGSRAIAWKKVEYVCQQMSKLRADLIARSVSMPDFISVDCWVAIGVWGDIDWRLLSAYSKAAKTMDLLAADNDSVVANWELSLLSGRRLKASNPKDHIYAMLAICKLRLTPDYSMRTTIGSVYRDYVAAWLEDWKAGKCGLFDELSILIGSGCAIEPNSPLPSWTPNYPALNRDGFAKRDIFQGNAERGVFPLETHPPRILDMSLFVSGIDLEPVTTITFCNFDTLLATTMFDFLVNFMAKGETYPTGISRLEAIFKLFLPQTCGRSDTWDISTLQKVLYFLKKLVGGNERLPDRLEFSQTRLQRMGLSTESPMLFMSSFKEVYGASPSEADDVEEKIEEELLLTWFDDLVAGRSGGGGISDLEIMSVLEEVSECHLMDLFTTSSGYIGLCRQGVQAGDRVCVLKGSDVLWLLRRSSGDEYYVNVCSCHVVGLMNGEVAHYFGERSIERFELR